MRILLDTHYLIWAVGKSIRLLPRVRALLEAPENDIYFSAVSIWEIAIKAELKRRDFPVRPDVMAQEARETGFTELALTCDDAAAVVDLPLHHRDPFDRLLVAQALAMPARLLTADAALVPYSELVWLEAV